MASRSFTVYYGRHFHQNMKLKSRQFHCSHVTRVTKPATSISEPQKLKLSQERCKWNSFHKAFSQVSRTQYNTFSVLRACYRQFHYAASLNGWDPVDKKVGVLPLDDEVCTDSNRTLHQTDQKDAFSCHGNKSFIFHSNEEQISFSSNHGNNTNQPVSGHIDKNLYQLNLSQSKQPLQPALDEDSGSNLDTSGSHGNHDSTVSNDNLGGKSKSKRESSDGDNNYGSTHASAKDPYVEKNQELDDVSSWNNKDLPDSSGTLNNKESTESSITWNNKDSINSSGTLNNRESVSSSSSLEIITPNENQSGILSPSQEDDDLDISGTEILPLERKQKTKQLPVHNLAAIVDKSPTLIELVKLGVDFSELEKVDGAADLVAKLDFDKDIRPHLLFLHDVGVPQDQLGHYLSKNPLVLEKDIAELKTKINYLESKRFSAEAIARIVSKCYIFLVLPVTMVDAKLGFLQKRFKLKGDEVRSVVTRQPKLIAWKTDRIKDTLFYIKEFLGFSESEMRKMLLAQPKVFLTNKHSLGKKFDFLHNEMLLDHDRLVAWPNVFRTRLHILQQRHRYLDNIGRAQYDPEKENYVSLKALVSSTDREFCQRVAKTSVEHFHEFLKTV